MSGNEITMDEKYFDLQNKLIENKLSSIEKALESFGRDVKKVLDDHEARLRDQAKTASTNSQEIVIQNAVNAQELNSLKAEQRELKQEIVCLKEELSKRYEESVREQSETAKKELNLWQTIAIEALKYAAFGATGGGVAVAIVKLFGIAI